MFCRFISNVTQNGKLSYNNDSLPKYQKFTNVMTPCIRIYNDKMQTLLPYNRKKTYVVIKVLVIVNNSSRLLI